jgi:hypothetical protein
MKETTRKTPRSRWENEIRMDLREIAGVAVQWIQLAQIGAGGGLL